MYISDRIGPAVRERLSRFVRCDMLGIYDGALGAYPVPVGSVDEDVSNSNGCRNWIEVMVSRCSHRGVNWNRRGSFLAGSCLCFCLCNAEGGSWGVGAILTVCGRDYCLLTSTLVSRSFITEAVSNSS